MTVKMRLTAAAVTACCDDSGCRLLMKLQLECVWRTGGDGGGGIGGNKRRQQWGTRGGALRRM